MVAAIRDAAGNMGYATNEFFITVITNGNYQYNAAGCITNIAYTGTEHTKNISLEWHSQYQLTNSTVLTGSATSSVSYVYDVSGRRTGRTEGAEAEQYLYDGNQVVADLDGDGKIIRTYTWGTGIDNLLSFTDHVSSNTYYAIKDHLNSVHAFVDESGNIVESYQYDAWGRTTVFNQNGNQLAESAIGNRYTFQGREMDWSTGLIYFRARWYDPVTGRFISKDLIGISGGLNQYVFCSNNPINARDPSGLVDWGLVGRGVVGVIANGAMAVGGATLSGTGFGAAVAVYGAYQTGASLGNIINGFLGNSEGPVGPVQATTQAGILQDIPHFLRGIFRNPLLCR